MNWILIEQMADPNLPRIDHCTGIDMDYSAW